MATRNQQGVSLKPKDLNSLDEAILDHLDAKGRASPTLLMREEDIDKSRQWVSSRFIRLAEHEHIRDVHDTGIYELVDDPRGETAQDAPQEGSDVEGMQARIDALEARADDLRAENERLREHGGIDPDDLRPILAALEAVEDVSDWDEVIERLRAVIEDQ